MRYPFKEVYNLADLNKPLPSIMIQEKMDEGVNVYSLGAGTSMAPQSYRFYKMLFVKQGSIRVITKKVNGDSIVEELKKGDGIITMKDRIISTEAIEDAVYLEVLLGQTITQTMQEIGKVFSVGEVGDYVEKNYTVTMIIASGFGEVKVICMDQATIDKTIDTTTMIFVYEGDCEFDVDGKKFIVHPDESMRFMPGTHLRVHPINKRSKVGVTNYYI